MGAVDEGFAEVKLAARQQVFGEPMQDLGEDAGFGPRLKAPETRGIGGIACGHIRPRRARAEHPQHPIEGIARVAPRSPATVLPERRRWQDGCNRGPLRIC